MVKFYSFIFDIDKTIGSPGCLENKVIRNEFLKIVDYCNYNKRPIFIVTTRPIRRLYSDETIEETEFYIFSDRVHKYIYKGILKNVAIINGKPEPNKTNFLELFKLNRDPNTRWFYYLNMVDGIPGVVNECCRYDKFRELYNNNKIIHNPIYNEENKRLGLPPRIFKTNHYGDLTTGFVKMLQLIDILCVLKHRYPDNEEVKFSRLIFFDDGKHNHQALKIFKETFPEMEKLKFFTSREVVKKEKDENGNIKKVRIIKYKDCVFYNIKVFWELNEHLKIDFNFKAINKELNKLGIKAPPPKNTPLEAAE